MSPADRVLVESAHPHAVPAVQSWDVSFSCGAAVSWVALVFDPRCATAGKGDKLTVYRDGSRRERLTEFYGPAGAWPAEPVLIAGSTCTLVFEVGLGVFDRALLSKFQ